MKPGIFSNAGHRGQENNPKPVRTNFKSPPSCLNLIKGLLTMTNF